MHTPITWGELAAAVFWIFCGTAIIGALRSGWVRLNEKAEEAIEPTPIRGTYSPEDVVLSRSSSLMPAGTPDHIRYFRPRSLEAILGSGKPNEREGLPFGEYAQDEFNRIEAQRLAEEAAKYGPK